MTEIIKLIVQVVNNFHDLLIKITNSLGFTLTDKELHFWLIGLIGILLFAVTQIVFKIFSKWSITAISFIYTFTILIIIVFAIEIQQKITGRGNMEFADIAAGIYGFFFLFSIYLVIKFSIILIVYLKTRGKRKVK
jgi:hypothetical protein